MQGGEKDIFGVKKSEEDSCFVYQPLTLLNLFSATLIQGLIV